MTPYLQQRLEALDLVLTSKPIAHADRALRLDSRANASRGQSRKASMVKMRKVQEQRSVGAALAIPFYPLVQTTSSVIDFFAVRLTRFGPRPLDGDNLEAAFKAVVDGVARKLCIDDGDPFVRYVVDQEKGPYAVRAELYVRRLE